jgi:hypothetical protein
VGRKRKKREKHSCKKLLNRIDNFISFIFVCLFHFLYFTSLSFASSVPFKLLLLHLIVHSLHLIVVHFLSFLFHSRSFPFLPFVTVFQNFNSCKSHSLVIFILIFIQHFSFFFIYFLTHLNCIFFLSSANSQRPSNFLNWFCSCSVHFVSLHCCKKINISQLCL